MTYKRKLRVFTTLIFAILLMTFGHILSASMSQRAIASTGDQELILQGTQINSSTNRVMSLVPEVIFRPVPLSQSDSFAQSGSETVTAGIGTFFDQFLIIDTLQTTSADNVCNESGSGDNNAICNANAENIASMSSTETATDTATGNANFNQDSNATVVQQTEQQNSCNESGSGDNNAFCNSAALNLVDSITQTS